MAFTVESLLEEASRRTGLADFGPPDFREGLAVLLEGLDTEAAIAPERRPQLRERLLRLLVNRLWCAKDLAEHPEILREDPGSPIVIASLPRTGSTKLHRLLGASGDFQHLTFWKAHMPSRIPGEADGGLARRIHETRDYERWMYATSPSILVGHPLFTDEAEEDQWLVEGTFRHPLHFGMYDSMRYAQWILQADMEPTFTYFRTLIQYLQWQAPQDRTKPWLLKTPNHLGNERHIARHFAQPRFIVTHRDPGKCIPSVASTAMAMRWLYSDRDTTAAVGAGSVHLFAQAALEHLRWRDANPGIPVLDLSFREVTEDALGAARKVYAFLGLALTPRAEAAMRRWEQDNPRDKHGKSTYSAEGIGLTQDAIRDVYAPYIARFREYL
ncbi:MAG TPA: sulfotransferase [Nevskiaceae bacterium]|nr:sulfotransferase [Nevskiaceae bacterium]